MAAGETAPLVMRRAIVVFAAAFGAGCAYEEPPLLDHAPPVTPANPGAGAPSDGPVAAGAAQPSTSPRYGDHSNLMIWIDGNGLIHTVDNTADWAIRRGHIMASLEVVMGTLPNRTSTVPMDMRVIEETNFGTYTRKRISFAVETGDRVPAWLLVPNGFEGPVPALLALHQTTVPWSIGKDEPAGIDDAGADPTMAYAKELTEGRGYVTLAPDYPGFGEYTIDPYALGYVSATMKGVFNHMRAIDVLTSLPEVDASRIGVIGHSLGGVNAIFLGAFDDRVQVVVSSCGFTTFARYMSGDLSPWATPVYMLRISSWFHDSAAEMPFDFPEVIGALAPRAFFASAPEDDFEFDPAGVDDSVRAASLVYGLYDSADELTVVHPAGGHAFPDAARTEAYDFIDGVLRAN
jgi:hypothetical protein